MLDISRCEARYLVRLSFNKLTLIGDLPLVDAELSHQSRAVKEMLEHRGTKIKLPGAVLDQTATDPGWYDSLSSSPHWLIVFLQTSSGGFFKKPTRVREGGDTDSVTIRNGCTMSGFSLSVGSVLKILLNQIEMSTLG